MQGASNLYQQLIRYIGHSFEGIFRWPVMSLQTGLPYILNKCDGFRKLFMQTLCSGSPASVDRPWRFLLYADEITPGNPLRPDNKRKQTAIYCSFLEFGASLSSEYSWLTLGVVRGTVLKTINGGLSGAMRCLVRSMFIGDSSIGSAGILLPTGSIFFCKYHRFISDEAAGKAIFSTKGAAGIRPCMSCKNVVKRDDEGKSLLEYDPSGYLVDITCCDPSKFDGITDSDSFAAYDSLTAMVAAGARRADVDRAEKANGFTVDPYGIMSDLEVREIMKPSTYVRDPMHIMLCGGVMNCEFGALFRALKHFFDGRRGAPFSFAVMREFVGADWLFPKHSRATAAIDVFSDIREAASFKDNKLKAGASEQLRIYPLVRRFLEVLVPAGQLLRERLSFTLCCDVIDLAQEIKRGALDKIGELKRKAAEFFRAHLSAYNDEFVIPKHHYMFHMHVTAEEDSFWYDCFVHERKHQRAKDNSEHIRNTASYEESVLTTILHSMIGDLQTDITPDELLEPCAHCAELSEVFGVDCSLANRMRFARVPIGVGDVLFSGSGACLVEACLLVGQDFALLVEPLALMERITATTSRFNEK